MTTHHRAQNQEVRTGVRESVRGQGQARKIRSHGQRPGQEVRVSEDKPRGAGGPAHGWCSWGQNSPCGCSHIGTGQDQSGRRCPGVGTGSSNRGSLWARNRDQTPLVGTRGVDASGSSVLTQGTSAFPEGPLCSHSHERKAPSPAVSRPCSGSSVRPASEPSGEVPPPCLLLPKSGRGSV